MNLKQCKQAIKDKGITPIEGKVYNIYKCGCITLNNDLPKRQLRLNGDKNKTRCCRECREDGPIIAKFKLCPCGEFFFGDRFQDAGSCKKCYINLHVTEDARSLKFNNSHLNDPSRYACVLRTGCLMKYIKFRCVPCKGCKDYQMAQGVRDPAMLHAHAV